MKKSFHWGHGIALFYIVFVIAVITVLIKSFSVDHSLVVDDYYAHDIAYQKEYDKRSKQLKEDNIQIDYSADDRLIKLVFNNQSLVKGKIYMYRPSNKKQDFEIEVVDTQMLIPTHELEGGVWKIKVDWSSGGESFYHIKQLYL
jgi:nitrogen fixation protein FixH